MSLSTNISGHVCLGGGVSKFVAYKIIVNLNGIEWIIYRRYREFRNLYESLLTEVGEPTLQSSHVSLPEKEKIGSYGSTFDIFLPKRTQYLQEFLNSLISLNKSETIPSFRTFLDIENRGVSGLSMEIGASRILKETFAKVHFTNYPYVDVGDRSYVVLTKAGSLYIMKSMYDSSLQAKMKFALTDPGIQILSRGNRMADIFFISTKKHLVIKFISPEEFIVWLRAFNDFTLNTDSAAGADRSASPSLPQASKTGAASNSNQGQAASFQTGSTGGEKTDEMSAAYGI